MRLHAPRIQPVDVDRLDAADAVGDRREARIHLAPVLGVENAAADVSVQADDPHPEFPRGGEEVRTLLHAFDDEGGVGHADTMVVRTPERLRR